MLARRAPASFALALASIASGCLIGGCQQSENAVLIEARTQGDVESIEVTVIDRSGGQTPSRSSPRPIRRSARDVNSGDPIRIAVPLPGPMDVIVHVVATGSDPDDRFVATRCYTVNGLVRDTVLLVGPIGTDIDGDADGFPEDPGGACRDPGEGTSTMPCDFACPRSAGGDCDDADDTIHPGARELCRDDVDQDCDGADAECEDRDGDGYRTCSAADAPGTCDCEDAIAEVNPGAEEQCRDGVDQDCDGRDGLCDQDGDGFVSDRDVGGSPDCDDTDADVHPGAVEVCTSRDDPMAIARDEDCNGFIDDAADCTGDDLDRDGSPACADLATTPCPRTDCDCNDCDPAIRPSATEVCGNGIDEDQRGGDSPCPAVDADRDGFAPASAGGADCDDANAAAFPGAPERCGDGVAQSCIADTDCAGDTDSDGFVAPADCGPDDPAQAPGIVEQCNQLDDDCDGVTNEVLAAPSASYPQGTSGCVLGDARLGADCAGSAACITDFTTSVFHCGGCRVACNVPGGDVVADQCVDGVCDCSSDSSTTAPCTTGTTCCAGAGCRDLDTDIDHCGYCGLACDDNADACVGGTCTCMAAGAACDPTSANDTCCGAAGCVDLQSDNLNCGVCGNVCGPSSTCMGGRCVCDPNFDDCDFIPSNGCEIDLRTTVAHCGACTNRCTRAGATSACVASTCQIGSCDALRDDCDGVDSNGCETALDTVATCGSCTTACTRANATPTCTGGTCAILSCNAGFGNCDTIDSTGCERNLRTLTDCGGCNMACNLANGTETCSTGACRVMMCDAGYDNCDGLHPNGCEVNLRTDVNNCGSCGNQCGANAACVMGACMCTGGYQDCDGATTRGCETDPQTSRLNCGGCGMACPATADRCVSASCQCGGSAPCNTAVADRCTSGACQCGTGAACSATLSDACSGGSCRCGSGAACSSTTADSCTSGACRCGGAAACSGTTDRCVGGACQCGSTGVACSGLSDRCTSGACVCGASGSACSATTADSCASGACRCGSGPACSGLSDRCTSGSCGCGTGPACDAMTANACVAGACRCGSSAECGGTTDRCTAGACRCGSGPACDPATADTCAGGTCQCGTGAACDPTKADSCTAGDCRCGSGAACTGSRVCTAGSCV